MSAIFKREFRSYMNNVVGYVFLAFFLVFAGLICLYFNIILSQPHFENSLEILAVVLIIAMPVLTMHAMSAEHRNHNDRWLYSLPLKSHSVVLGKYFAMLAVFGIACAVLSLYPALLRLYGLTSLGVAYTSLIGFFLLGAAVLALCTFLASLTGNAFVSALIGLGGTLALYLFDLLASVVPAKWLASLISSLSPFSRFSSVCAGVFDLKTVVFDICFAVFFLYLTTQVMESKRRR